MSEKYPAKRAYAVGKLYKFLKEKGIYKQFAYNCKEQKIKHGNKTKADFLNGFLWALTKEDDEFWRSIYWEFNE